MTIRDLQIIAAVGHSLNMSKAANDLLISQSSVSQVIMTIEKEFQVKLFIRGKNLKLTSNGQRFLEHANIILGDIENLKRNMEALKGRSVLRLGSCVMIAQTIIYQILEEMQNIFPSLEIPLEVADTADLLKDLRKGVIDVAIIHRNPKDKSLICRLLFNDAMSFVCSASHPLAGKHISWDVLEKYKLVTYDNGSYTRKILDHLLAVHHCNPAFNGIYYYPADIKTAVLHNRGIAFLTDICTRNERKQGLLSRIKIDDIKYYKSFYLVYRKNFMLDETMTKWVKFICQSGYIEHFLNEE
ncbi:LysR family transcriptional regulator [Megasphaera paucivorans]|uniref:DNA-binding transcriptional regulator, LysR family n=1 Tax=Megasphaera paucivorans TaxID=349095 RepID=A0A1H0C1F8_9FIRM|nr:LysR family transcriptional regulator [Megasphaera paucivorans]SDN51660.1 DNA-binding transcriptional regulator, LysR family [Megasphaera paucivorans]